MRETEKRVVSIFKALGSHTRFNIVKLLENGSMYTNQIAEALSKDKSTISKHLKILKDLDIVRFVTKERHVYYRLKKRDVPDLIRYAETQFGRE